MSLVDRDAGIVDQQVHFAEFRNRGVEQCLYLACLADIGPDGNRFTAGSVYLRNHLVCGGLICWRN